MPPWTELAALSVADIEGMIDETKQLHKLEADHRRPIDIGLR